MISAAIDVGSNTVRMLLAEKGRNTPSSGQYFRQVTRLSGDYHPEYGLSSQRMECTLQALKQFADHLHRQAVTDVRIVGTEALRRAVNSADFIAQVRRRTGLEIEVIDGTTEAGISCRGILSVLDPAPTRAILFDIGGGSTEIILLDRGKIRQQMSLPLGVVRLLEEFPDAAQCDVGIHQRLQPLIAIPLWQQWKRENLSVELIGTAGTVTTLAALNLSMDVYEGSRINNLNLKRSWLRDILKQLETLSLKQRHALPGMEKGRGDIIMPGLQLVLALLDLARLDTLRVSDAGLLEGLLLE